MALSQVVGIPSGTRELSFPASCIRTQGLALALLVLVVYANAVANGFVLDDRAIIFEHVAVRDAKFWRAFVSPYWPEAIGGGQYRPLGLLSFALDRALTGDSPVWFHAVNVAWHLAATVLVWRFALRHLAPTSALFAAAVFAVHPVHVEAVANVVGRLELMAASFVIAALLAHERKSWIAVLLYLAACLSKEHAVVFLPLALAMHVVLDQKPSDAIRARAHLWIAYLVATAAWLTAMLFVTRNAPPIVSEVFADLTTGQRMMTVLSIVPEYLRLLVFPVHLSADYEPGVLTAVTRFDANVVPGMILVVVWFWVIARSWRRHPVAAFAMLCVPIALAPVSNVLFPTGVALAERTLYLPSVGVCLAAGWMFTRASERSRTVTMIFVAIVLSLGALRTWTRTPVWRDSRTFFLRLMEDHPESYRAHWMAGRALRASGDLEGARREFSIALQISPRVAVLRREALELGVTPATR